MTRRRKPGTPTTSESGRAAANEPTQTNEPLPTRPPLPGPVTPWLPMVAVAAWFLGAMVAAPAGVWVGLGCTAVLLGALVSAREWALMSHLLRPRATFIAAGVGVGAAMTLATKLLYLPLSVDVPLVARDMAFLYGNLGADVRWWRLFLLLLPVITGEEIVWRGLVQGALARRFGRISAVPLASSLYALAHAPVGSPVLVATALSCGLVWGGLRGVTGGLVASLVAHVLWDDMVLFISPVVIR